MLVGSSYHFHCKCLWIVGAEYIWLARAHAIRQSREETTQETPLSAREYRGARDLTFDRQRGRFITSSPPPPSRAFNLFHFSRCVTKLAEEIGRRLVLLRRIRWVNPTILEIDNNNISSLSLFQGSIFFTSTTEFSAAWAVSDRQGRPRPENPRRKEHN